VSGYTSKTHSLRPQHFLSRVVDERRECRLPCGYELGSGALPSFASRAANQRVHSFEGSSALCEFRWGIYGRFLSFDVPFGAPA